MNKQYNTDEVALYNSIMAMVNSDLKGSQEFGIMEKIRDFGVAKVSEGQSSVHKNNEKVMWQYAIDLAAQQDVDVVTTEFESNEAEFNDYVAGVEADESLTLADRDLLIGEAMEDYAFGGKKNNYFYP